MDLSFLDDVSIADADVKVRRTGAPRTKYPDNGADLRVYSNGEVFPSPKFVEKYGLEYGARHNDKPVGNGLDVINSMDWAPTAQLPQRLLFICATPREEGKIDLFGNVAYNKEDGRPMSSVLSQGAATFGKEVLLPLLKEVYDLEPTAEQNFIDLKVMDNRAPLTSPSGIYHIPKRISRGEKKGENTYTRREKVNIFALVPFQAEESGESAEGESAAGERKANRRKSQAGPAVKHETL